jgi:hypothetical protein
MPLLDLMMINSRIMHLVPFRRSKKLYYLWSVKVKSIFFVPAANATIARFEKKLRGEANSSFVGFDDAKS